MTISTLAPRARRQMQSPPRCRPGQPQGEFVKNSRRQIVRDGAVLHRTFVRELGPSSSAWSGLVAQERSVDDPMDESLRSR